MADQRNLLILDLDETLVYATETLLDRSPDFSVHKYAVYRRPFLDQFLATVAGWYDLAVWSSASKLYVEAIVAEVLRGVDLRFVWAKDRLTAGGGRSRSPADSQSSVVRASRTCRACPLPRIDLM